MQRFEYLVVDTDSGGIKAIKGEQVRGGIHKADVLDRVIGIKDAFSPERAPKIWDYLNKWGNEGWELVAVAGMGVTYLYTLKRPLQ